MQLPLMLLFGFCSCKKTDLLIQQTQWIIKLLLTLLYTHYSHWLSLWAYRSLSHLKPGGRRGSPWTGHLSITEPYIYTQTTTQCHIHACLIKLTACFGPTQTCGAHAHFTQTLELNPGFINDEDLTKSLLWLWWTDQIVVTMGKRGPHT